MDINTQIREGVRLLEGIEDGDLPTVDCYNIIDKIDSVMTSLIVRYLRKKYPVTHQDSAGVMARLVDLTSTYPQVVQAVKEGEQDPISEWFEDTYSYRDFYAEPEKFISLIVEKLEG